LCDDPSRSLIRRIIYVLFRGHKVAVWLRHYAASRKVAGSRPDELNFFSNLPRPPGEIPFAVKINIYIYLSISNPSGRTMALGSTQPLTEIRTRNL
jgi:hypothetical protein